ncbi:zinc ribbon domain-containing protein [Enterobacter ludwigii]|uniref:zinc ribbon domain-containing protein n=1 Tax=Enterobacter ludwigii TaxID=299767 RepID=UPI003F6FD2DD
MALVNCPACNNNVSESAFKCPSCGHQIKKPKRTLFGKLMKWVFILFNLLMIYSVFAGLGGSSEVYHSAANNAERAGAAIGTGLGMIMLGSIWVVGDIILGMFVLFTRPKS